MGIIDNAKDIADLVKKIGDIDLYRKIVELEGEIIELTREKRHLEERNEGLERFMMLKKEMVFKKPFYFQEGDSQPYCPRCWEAGEKAIHLHGPGPLPSSKTYYNCPDCKYGITLP